MSELSMNLISKLIKKEENGGGDVRFLTPKKVLIILSNQKL